jgi:hypothetical protein
LVAIAWAAEPGRRFHKPPAHFSAMASGSGSPGRGSSQFDRRRQGLGGQITVANRRATTAPRGVLVPEGPARREGPPMIRHDLLHPYAEIQLPQFKEQKIILASIGQHALSRRYPRGSNRSDARYSAICNRAPSRRPRRSGVLATSRSRTERRSLDRQYAAPIKWCLFAPICPTSEGANGSG